MTPVNFCYWLQGLFEIGKVDTLTPEQVKVVKNHLNLVFKHSIDTPDPTGELQSIHDGKPIGLSKPDRPEMIVRC